MPRGPALRRSQFLGTTRPATSVTDNVVRGLPDELIEKGFGLAYFLFPDHPTAINILTGALEKLDVQCQREKKRAFWRDKHPSQPVRRIIRKDSDVFQWLILQEAEKYELEQEEVDAPSKKDLILRYIKHLVQITTAMSSFYVNIAVSRLLHNYTTSEAQLTYESLTQRYLGADEYRRAKSSVMDRIKQRFSKFLTVVKAEHGEFRFEAADDQQHWCDFVNGCLRAFTPWSTEGACSRFCFCFFLLRFSPRILRAFSAHSPRLRASVVIFLLVFLSAVTCGLLPPTYLFPLLTFCENVLPLLSSRARMR